MQLSLIRKFSHYQLDAVHKFRVMSSAKPQSIFDLEAKHVAHNYKLLPVALERGEGIFVSDGDGRRYFDFLSTYSAGEYEKFMTNLFDYGKLLLMNSGVEDCESALKLVRRWAYDVKRVPENKAEEIFVESSFGEKSLATVSSSTGRESYGGFGEAGVRVSKDDYLRKAAEICVRRLCFDYENFLILGKALSGGCYPILAVLSCRIAMAAVRVVEEENLATNAFKMGQLFHQQMHGLPSAIVKDVRGTGLLNAIEINNGYDAWELCIRLLKIGLLAKTVRENKI
ncbi:Ornithine aminotransferase, mitochondrial [Trichinella pseudospiralis]|uniref:Ornithine aminotransferase n=1 Tax=Trichinella pseudospiralis TaxID=6337 RepID=A0A0V1FPC1_TRIPS|nr:Ornithine aminotransferase, mitochondrial [Trichinella pseudospiralis]